MHCIGRSVNMMPDRLFCQSGVNLSSCEQVALLVSRHAGAHKAFVI